MKLIFKSLFDFTLSILLLFLLSPVFLLIAILIKLDSKGPVFFKQERAGKDGKPFIIYKFRTMIDNAVNVGLGLLLAENDSRITSIGNFLRNWSLDELAQIINIIKGEMSFIGPRPTLKNQVAHYDDFQIKRLQMKPGITGWAQVNGRNSLTWEERLPLDVWYVENYSLVLDLKILIKTIEVLLFKKGLYAPNGINEGFGPTVIPASKKQYVELN